ncbi:ATP-binding cassette domain-containing protein [Shimia sp. MMG029]|uniref:ATP-binding cassette domain-containing protein n=1 Tax=Shimia sp. MMG029 TaxID=3021978 RepID=UPI0022FE3ACA|nr:ATP-binding cassette domain-containing protein [Shimia sp. MMG029]MDA5557900.1 ATP-binding cassette domain-containing protein [Shimia sp. MMG029]
MQTSPLTQLKRLLPPLIGLSALSNLAVLISPIFMMQVLDRVIPTENLHTLILLLVVAVGAFLLQAIVDGLRDVTLQYSARWSETLCLPEILSATPERRQTLIASLATLKNSLLGATAVAALTMPWLPLFVAVLWLIHPLFVALACALLAVTATLRITISGVLAPQQAELNQTVEAESHAQRDAQTTHALRGLDTLSRNLMSKLTQAMAKRATVEDQMTPVSAASTAAQGLLRNMAQLLGLSLGAGLVVNGTLSAGGMIAASLILMKTVNSFETALAALPDMRAALAAYQDLRDIPNAPSREGTTIDTLSGALRCEGLIAPRGAGAPPRLDRISFQLSAGQCLAIIGPSGSGKTTLLDALSGAHPCPIGAVWLDETEVKTLPIASHAKQIGFLPQQAQLFHGTLAQNIASFALDLCDADVIAAAKTAGVHGLISALPHSYDTDIGAMPHLLSAGQKQRVALARAIYHRPRYLFLDEPNALLDAAGERQLCAALARLKSDGTTVVMVLHRSGLMGLADQILSLENGRMADFGTRAEVLGRMSSGRRRIELPLRATSLQDLTDWVSAQFTRASDAPLSKRAELVATELFALAQASGATDAARTAVFLFRFLSEQSCELTVTEAGHTAADTKMRKVADLLRHPDANIAELPSDEAALAVLSQMSDRLDIQNQEGQSVYRAAISTRTIALQGVARH